MSRIVPASVTNRPLIGWPRGLAAAWRATVSLLNRVALAAAIFFAQHVGAQEQGSAMTLLQAASEGDVAEVKRLLAAGTPVDTRDVANRTPLLLATQVNRIEAASVLIAAGADVNAKDDMKDTPYLYAAAEGRLEILKMTLAAGANLKDTNRYGGTGLIPAAHHGHPEVVKLLLTTSIDKDHVNNLGWTALLEAVILGDGGAIYQNIVKQLVDAGARQDLADRDGITPLAHAQSRGYGEIASLLGGAK